MLRQLEGKVQVYLPDLKYALPEPARRYSGAEDYFQWASAAILEMFRQTGPYVMENGQLKRGVLIRHLLLPGEMENTRRCIDFVAGHFQPGEVLFSLMSQYTPQPGAGGTFRRHVTRAEYRAVGGVYGKLRHHRRLQPRSGPLPKRNTPRILTAGACKRAAGCPV